MPTRTVQQTVETHSQSTSLVGGSRLLILAGLVMSLMLAVSAPAAAQNAEEDPFAGVEEMIVTGAGGAALLAPASTSAISFDSTQLDAYGVEDLSDIAAYVPNLEIRSQNAVPRVPGHPRKGRVLRDASIADHPVKCALLRNEALKGFACPVAICNIEGDTFRPAPTCLNLGNDVLSGGPTALVRQNHFKSGLRRIQCNSSPNASASARD